MSELRVDRIVNSTGDGPIIYLDSVSNEVRIGTGVTIDGSTGIIEASAIVIGSTTITGSAVTSITAGSGISVDQSTGNVTISATGGGGGGESYWVSTAAGIHTLGNVGVGTTNPLVQLQINGTLGFEVFTGTYGNRGLNISIGDTTTASNIIPDADGNQGINNIFMGIGAGNSTTTGVYNNFFGTKAGRDSTTGSYNNFFGLLAGGGKRGIITSIGITSTTTLVGEANNSYSGVSATGGSGIDADFSVFRNGSGAVIEVNITSGGYDYNVGDILTIDGVDVGGSSGTDDITITVSTVVGSTNTGNDNNFLGDSAGRYNTTGYNNNFLGENAGRNNISGYNNNFFGYFAGRGKRGIITSINIGGGE
jgi:hypothetical protein